MWHQFARYCFQSSPHFIDLCVTTVWHYSRGSGSSGHPLHPIPTIARLQTRHSYRKAISATNCITSSRRALQDCPKRPSFATIASYGWEPSLKTYITLTRKTTSTWPSHDHHNNGITTLGTAQGLHLWMRDKWNKNHFWEHCIRYKCTVWKINNGWL